MKKTQISRVFQSAAFAAIAFLLMMLPFSGAVSAAQPGLNAANIGYVGPSYGTDVKVEPTADNPQSKLWFNDGYWWGILFDDASNQYAIYRLNWPGTWVKTATNLDSRNDMTGTPSTPSGTVDTRFDALWDGTKLYVASHIRTLNPANTNNIENRGRLYRYSYNAGTDTYSLDGGFPATNVSLAKVSEMVLDKDSDGRLWVTYVARPSSSDPYQVYVTYTTTPGNDLVWSAPISMRTFNTSAGTVAQSDVSSVVTYGDKVGVMWSNQLNGNFYYAEIDAGDNPATGANWNIVPVLAGTVGADDHIKMVANSAGQVFVAVKTVGGQTGMIARATNGTFSYHPFSIAETNDTHPTLAYNASTNTVYMFVASNEQGGFICVDSTVVTSPLSNMEFGGKPCSTNPAISAQHFIENDTYININNPTTTKRPFSNNTGLVVLASDQDNGQRYLHNVIQPGGGGPDPVLPEKIYLPIIRRN